MRHVRQFGIPRLLICIVTLACLSSFVFSITLAQKIDSLPTKEHPLVIDSTNRRVLVYAEVNEQGSAKISTHFGIVFKDGKLADKALFRAYATPSQLYDALYVIGMKQGDNLTEDSRGKHAEGDPLDVSLIWPGLNREFPLKNILTDSGGKGFDIRFGGNKRASALENSGCLTCLESCWVGITSNAAYPMTSTLKRYVSPNSKFSINSNLVPSKGGEPVIIIYSVRTGK